MRVLVISDIHANIVALDYVMAHAAGRYDTIWCLGDVVGYGPRPNECVEFVRQYASLCVIGNHDWVAIDLPGVDLDDFNPLALRAINWTREKLKADNRSYLATLPRTPLQPLATHSILVTHASPRMPVWEYIADASIAQANFSVFNHKICFVGHTHVQSFFCERPLTADDLEDPKQVVDVDNFTAIDCFLPRASATTIKLNFSPDVRLIVNPGSVGQPRDENQRAAYGLLDLETMNWRFERVEYPVEQTQQQMRQERLPRELIERLAYGY